MSALRTVICFAPLLAAILAVTGCATDGPPADPTAADYPTPTRVDNQVRVQEMHGDILRNDF